MVPVCALCIFYLLVMAAVLAAAAIAKLPILLREKETTLILGDISQGQSLPMRPSLALSTEKRQMREHTVFYYRVMSNTQEWKRN